MKREIHLEWEVIMITDILAFRYINYCSIIKQLNVIMHIIIKGAMFGESVYILVIYIWFDLNLYYLYKRKFVLIHFITSRWIRIKHYVCDSTNIGVYGHRDHCCNNSYTNPKHNHAVHIDQQYHMTMLHYPPAICSDACTYKEPIYW